MGDRPAGTTPPRRQSFADGIRLDTETATGHSSDCICQQCDLSRRLWSHGDISSPRSPPVFKALFCDDVGAAAGAAAAAAGEEERRCISPQRGPRRPLDASVSLNAMLAEVCAPWGPPAAASDSAVDASQTLPSGDPSRESSCTPTLVRESSCTPTLVREQSFTPTVVDETRSRSRSVTPSPAQREGDLHSRLGSVDPSPAQHDCDTHTQQADKK